jgi:hypothetical protein
MVALRSSFREVVVTDEELLSTNMVAGFKENDNASRTRRATRWCNVLLKRSM